MTTMNIYNMADEWNNSGTTFTAIKMNVTDTASNANSRLMDLQVGGQSRFAVGKTGTVKWPGDPGGSGYVFQIEPAEAAAGKYSLTQIGGAVNPFSGRLDHVMRLGYNVAPGGGREKTSEPAFALEWESYYEPTQSATNWFEFHLAHYLTDGRVCRPISFVGNRDSLASTYKLMFSVNQLSILDTGMVNTKFDFVDNQFQLYPNALVLKLTNNQPWIYQYSTTGAGIELIRVNAANEVVVSPNTTYPTRFPGAVIYMANLPTSDPAVAGQLWNDNGTLKISAGV